MFYQVFLRGHMIAQLSELLSATDMLGEYNLWIYYNYPQLCFHLIADTVALTAIWNMESTINTFIKYQVALMWCLAVKDSIAVLILYRWLCTRELMLFAWAAPLAQKFI